MVHKNIHDDTLEEALEHENGLTVLGIKFQVHKQAMASRNPGRTNEGMDFLQEIIYNKLKKPSSEFKSGDLRWMRVIGQEMI